MVFIYNLETPWLRSSPAFLVGSVGFPQSPIIENGIRKILNLLLQCSHWVGLHDRPCWLCFDLHFLAKHISDSCLGGWFRSGFDAAQAMHCENARLLHLFRGNVYDSLQNIRAGPLFQAMLGGKCICQGALGHGFCGSFHRLHRLHWRHAVKSGVELARAKSVLDLSELHGYIIPA